ncbi:MAG: FecR domain-containing protein [Pseudomonadota bacterium]
MKRGKSENTSEAHSWRARYEAGLSASEERAFRQWHAEPENARAFAEIDAMWSDLSELDYPPALDQPLLSERLGQWLGTSAGALKTGVALSCVVMALVLGAVYLPWGPPSLSPSMEFRTATGEVQTFDWFDGSRITLGARSRVTLEHTERERRATVQSGVIYFHVASDPERPFRVTARGMAIRVTGTAFEVALQTDAVRVAVVEGRVEVGEDRSRETRALSDIAPPTLRLGRGDAVSLRGAGFSEISHTEASAVGAWREGLLTYVQGRLADIVADLDRHHARPLKVDAQAADLVVSGTFDASNPERVLQTLSEVLPITLVDLGPLGLLIRLS